MRQTVAILGLTTFLAGCGERQPAQQVWPKRPLIEPVFENSLEHRYRSKEVYRTAIVDDMEKGRGWSVNGIGRIEYTAERARDGKRSLRFQTSMRDEAHIKANRKDGSFIGGQGGSTSARLKFDQPQDWRPFNRISLWVFVHPTSMQAYSFSLRFECAGAPRGPQEPVPSHFVHDLKAGEWNQVIWEIPDHHRDNVTSLSISHTLRGHDPEDEGTVTYDFDRIEIQRVDVEHYEGWEVGPGKIAFHHLGYRPAGEKLAFASSGGGNQFELVDASSGASVASFPVKTVRNRRGRFQLLDFTSFAKPGRYLLRYGKQTSRPFALTDDLWYGAIEKALNFYYGERCGFDVPGVHRVCHQDWQGTHDGQTKIINGGWHDAGDLSQGSHRTGASVYALLQIYDQLRQRGVRPELRDRVLEEARWGLDWLLKTRFGKGYRITWALGRIYTDNKVGTIDDMVVPARHIAYENFLFSAVAAYASRVLKAADPRRADASLLAAREDYQATLDQRPDSSAATRDEAALAALASTELYRATGEEMYAGQAARWGRLLLQCQEQRFLDGIPITGYFYSDTQRQRIVHDHHMSFEESPLVALRALCETFPAHADWMEWYGAALLHSQYFYMQGTAASAPYDLIPNSVWTRAEIEALPETPRQSRGWNRKEALAQFNQGTRLSENRRLRVFPIWPDDLFHGNTAIQLSGTTALTAAAQLRNQPAVENLAARQLQWIFGGNPFSQTLMYGEGYDYQPHFAYCLRNLAGALPVGMDSMRNDTPHWSSTNRATYKEIWVVPVSRFLWTMAYAAIPAQISGTATAAASFRETRTGAAANVQPGKFALNLPPGIYEIAYGGAARRMALLAGGRYHVELDPARAIDFELSSDRFGEAIRITARARGAGTHKLELRIFNGSVDRPEATVDLTPGREERATWIVKTAAADKPWAAVVIPDGAMSAKKEIFGTLRQLPRIE